MGSQKEVSDSVERRSGCYRVPVDYRADSADSIDRIDSGPRRQLWQDGRCETVMRIVVDWLSARIARRGDDVGQAWSVACRQLMQLQPG